MEHGAKMGPQIIKIPYKNLCRKIIKLSSTKHNEMKVSNIENLRFSLRKNIHVLNFAFSEVCRKSHQKVIENHVKIHENSIKKSIQNRGAEKFRKMIPNLWKKGRKWSPKGSPKSTKSR